MPAAQQGVELLFPSGTGKHAKGAKLSKEEKLANALLKKLKAIEKGGNVNAADKRGQTALMHAAAANNRLAVCWLIAKGANATIKSLKGEKAAELTKDKSLQAFLEACSVDRRSLSDKEKKELQDAGFTKENTYGTENVDRDEGEELKLATQLLRLGCKEENLHHFGYPSSDPLYATLFSRHGYELNKAGEEMDWQKPEVLRLLLALGIKMGKGDALSQAKVAMLLDDAQTLHKIVEEHPDCATNRGLASKIIAYLGAPETLQVLIDAGLDPKVSWDYVYKNSTESFIQILLYGRRRSAAGIRALAAAGAPLPILSEHKNLLSRDLEDNEYDPEMVDALIEAGVDVNAVGSGQKTQRGTYSGVPPLIAAIRKGNGGEKAVKQLMDKGAKVDSRMLAPGTRDDGRTALQFALIWGETSVARLLIERGADVNAKDSSGIDVIHCALHSSYTPENGEKGEADFLSVVERLLKAGADVPKNILAEGGVRSGMSPGGREKLALMLLDAGADPLAKDKDGWTSLMSNGILGPKIAKRLLDAGVDPTVKCGEKEDSKVSAMSRAMKEGAVEVVKLLKEKGIDPGELWVVDPEEIEPLLELGARIPEDMTDRLMSDFKWVGHFQYPARSCEDYVKIIQILKQHGFKPELMAWAKKDHSNESYIGSEADFFRAFFKTGSNPNETDENGNSLLANFASSTESAWRVANVLSAFIEAGVDVNKPINRNGQTPLFYARDAETIAQLLRAGADARVCDAKGRTPLFPCHFSRDVDAERLLMQRGVRINAQDNEGNTVLMMAVTGSSSSVQALLDAGADPNIKNKAGKTALQIAQENVSKYYRNEIVKSLKKHGAKEEKVDPNAKDKEGRTALMQAALDPDGLDRLKECIAQKGDVNARDNKGCTALRLLFGQDGDINSRVSELLNAKADVNLGDSNDFTPLMVAACYKDTAKRRFRVQRLINAKVNVNAAGKAGNTAAMHLLLHYDDPDTLRMLLDAGAKPDHKNGEGKTMLDIASENHRNACIKLLNERFPASSPGHK